MAALRRSVLGMFGRRRGRRVSNISSQTESNISFKNESNSNNGDINLKSSEEVHCFNSRIRDPYYWYYKEKTRFSQRRGALS